MQAKTPHSINGHWWVSAAGVILAMMAIQMASLGFSPLLPAMTKELGASYAQMGLFTGMYGIVALFVSLPAGMLAARIGEKRAMLAGLIVTALGLVSLGNSSTFGMALGSRTLWLLGYRVAFIAVFTSMAIVTPAQFRSRTMGVLGALAALASVIGAPFGTRMAGSLGWRGGIFGFAAIALVGIVLFSLLYRSQGSKDVEQAASNGHPAPAASARALRNPVIWGMILLGLINMGGFSVTFFVPYAVKTVFGLDASEAAKIISTSYLVSMVLNLFFGWLCDRYSRWNMMIVLAFLLIPASLAVMSTDLLVFRAAVALVVSLGHAATNQLYAISGTLLSKEEVGKGIGMMGLGSGIFGYIGPQMLGYLRDSTGGFTAGWLFVAAAAVLSLIDLVILRAYSLRTTSVDARASLISAQT